MDNAFQLADRIRRNLVTVCGTALDTCSIEEFYSAFSLALRDEISLVWTEGLETFTKQNARMLYYLSMEYLPGRYLANNILNLKDNAIVRGALHLLGKDLSPLIEIDSDPGLGAGGLGRLASCFLDALATHHYPAMAYGLRYHYGYFKQQLFAGSQQEFPDPWLFNQNPWEFRRDSRSAYVCYGKEEVRLVAYDTPIVGYPPNGADNGVVTLRLWSAKESPSNFKMAFFNAGQMADSSENTTLTDVLYPNDSHESGKRIRIKQEFLLSSASIQDILRRHKNQYGTFDNIEDKVRIAINESHAAFAIVEMIRQLMAIGFSWGRAFETTKTCCHFTCHTVLAEALEVWEESRIQTLFPEQMQIIRRMDQEFRSSIKEGVNLKKVAIIDEGSVRMAHLCFYGSNKINGVSKVHTDLMKNTYFKEFNQLFPGKIQNVTNGITQRRWLCLANPYLAAWITKWLGSDRWIVDLKELEKLRAFSRDETALKELLAIKKDNKKRLIEHVKREHPLRDENGEVTGCFSFFDESALFDMHIKRMHEYKRQLLLMIHTIMLFHEIQSGGERIQRMIFVSGKAASNYEKAKQIVLLVVALSRAMMKDEKTKDSLRLFFVENYSVSEAEMLIPAADLSEQISLAGREASGTGNMKLALNGALTIGTEDGANIEMRQAVGDEHWPFKFGASAEENLTRKDYDPKKIVASDPALKKALDALIDGSIAERKEEREALFKIHEELLELGDPYFVLGDIRSYHETQKKVEALYKEPMAWAEKCVHNIAGMASFSADDSVKKYAKEIWGIEPVLPDKELLDMLRLK